MVPKETSITALTDIPGYKEAHRVYANGFAVALSNADVCVVLQHIDRAEVVLSLSYTTAKSMVEELGKVVDNWEKATGQQIQTTAMMTEKLRKGAEVNR